MPWGAAVRFLNYCTSIQLGFKHATQTKASVRAALSRNFPQQVTFCSGPHNSKHLRLSPQSSVHFSLNKLLVSECIHTVLCNSRKRSMRFNKFPKKITDEICMHFCSQAWTCSVFTSLWSVDCIVCKRLVREEWQLSAVLWRLVIAVEGSWEMKWKAVHAALCHAIWLCLSPRGKNNERNLSALLYLFLARISSVHVEIYKFSFFFFAKFIQCGSLRYNTLSVSPSICLFHTISWDCDSKNCYFTQFCSAKWNRSSSITLRLTFKHEQ